jgi:hypothetical protein
MSPKALTPSKRSAAGICNLGTWGSVVGESIKCEFYIRVRGAFLITGRCSDGLIKEDRQQAEKTKD